MGVLHYYKKLLQRYSKNKDISGIKYGGNVLSCLRYVPTCDNAKTILKAPQHRTLRMNRAYFKFRSLNAEARINQRKD